MTDTASERRVWQCRYCHRRVARYQTVCQACYAKLPLVRRLVAAGQLLKECAGRAKSGGDDGDYAD